MKIYFYLIYLFFAFPISTYALTAMVDTIFTVNIQGEGFDGHEAIKIEDGECNMNSIQYGSGFFTQECILNVIGNKKITVYDTTYDIPLEVSEEYQTVQVVLVDRKNPSTFNIQYGWWVDYMRKGKALKLAREARRENRIKENKMIKEIIDSFKKSGLNNPINVFNAKNQIRSIVTQSMQDYQRTLSPYVILGKEREFEEFVLAATQESILAYFKQVDELASR